MSLRYEPASEPQVGVPAGRAVWVREGGCGPEDGGHQELQRLCLAVRSRPPLNFLFFFITLKPRV